MRREIRIAGFGGQGIILTGVTLAQAAGIYEGYEITQSQSHGPEARGGAARCDVIISTEPIFYPRVRKPQIQIVMSAPAFERYGMGGDPGGLVLYNSSLIEPPSPEPHWVGIPASQIAETELSNVVAANMVMLGALSAVDPIVGLESMHRAVGDVMPTAFREINQRALKLGHERVVCTGESPRARG